VVERGGARFAFETFQCVRMWTQVSARTYNKRHEAAQLRVGGLVDHAHATGAQLLEDEEMRNRSA
jgi:hypothetical protein